MLSCFFLKENLICPNYIFPHCILISLIHCVLLSKEILLMPKITPHNTKNALQFLNIIKKHICLWQSKSLTMLRIFIAKWISRDNSNADHTWSEMMKNTSMTQLQSQILLITISNQLLRLLSQKIKFSNKFFRRFLSTKNNDSFIIIATNKEEIYKTISSLNINKSCGPNTTPNKILQLV